jgi:hypothetical protein
MKERQRPRDKVLWVLGESCGKMSMIRLRSQTRLPKAELDSNLEEMEIENKVVIKGNKQIIHMTEIGEDARTRY